MEEIDEADIPRDPLDSLLLYKPLELPDTDDEGDPTGKDSNYTGTDSEREDVEELDIPDMDSFEKFI